MFGSNDKAAFAADEAIKNIRQRIKDAGMGENADLFAASLTSNFGMAIIKSIMTCVKTLPKEGELAPVMRIVCEEIISAVEENFDATTQVH